MPVWIGKAAADILRAAEFWGTGIDLREQGHLHDQQTVTIGPFTITPYLVDHSAFDAYSLLVEADGRRLFYLGTCGRTAASPAVGGACWSHHRRMCTPCCLKAPTCATSTALAKA
ncbi:hypothetical protein ACFQX7_28080 [Luedemannella flava]